MESTVMPRAIFKRFGFKSLLALGFFGLAGIYLFATRPVPLQAEQASGRTVPVEMVFRAFYHYSRALTRGETLELVPYLVHHAKLLGLVKRRRQRHQEIQQTEQLVWGSP